MSVNDAEGVLRPRLRHCSLVSDSQRFLQGL
jgi:hypothetical protein